MLFGGADIRVRPTNSETDRNVCPTQFMDTCKPTTAEELRLGEDTRREKNWKRWGPYVAERQWGTVREDYSPNGACWNYFTHDHSRSRAYRWGEDGLLGWTDRECRLCFAVALWNGKDSILKERLFGLSNPEGNHGEDVKEYYFYLDATPTFSYCKALYKYPQSEFPYQRLVDENARRTKLQPEFELRDTGIFDENRYFDVYVEYAKASPDDMLIQVTVANRGPESAEIHLLPTIWMRNSWSWGCTHEGCTVKPRLQRDGEGSVIVEHPTLPRFRFEVEPSDGKAPELLFTDNETNVERIFGAKNPSPFVKDAFHEYVIKGKADAVNPEGFGTKVAAYCKHTIPPGGQRTFRYRLSDADIAVQAPFGAEFDATFDQRRREADEFFDTCIHHAQPAAQRLIARQAYAGLLWSKQFYSYVVDDWLDGDPDEPSPPPGHNKARNTDWRHVFARDVLSMPDKWEYPWFAAWDLAFHTVQLAYLDPESAKQQLLVLLREWYTHPSGQIPAYEFAFSDANPPVHAWACWRVYKITGPPGGRDRLFLERAFQKLLINFTWWVNRKDVEGRHVFAGGFLGLDNIGIFDRSQPLPGGGTLEQADGTAWMAFYCATMLAIAIELAVANPAYEDIASKFFEHFVDITDAINTLGGTGLWNEADGFYYDQLSLNGDKIPMRMRSGVGIIPLFAVAVLESHTIDQLPGFRKRMEWFLEHRQDLARHISYMERAGDKRHSHYLLAIPSQDRLRRVLGYVLDEAEFFSPHGVRSVSRRYKDNPFVFRFDGRETVVRYEPGESETSLFGGNSNWRGPIWMPINFLLIEALERYHHFYGDDFQIECPTGSGRMMNLLEVSRELTARLTRLFIPDESNRRPINGGDVLFDDPYWRDLVLFYEYFHGDTGRGCGASHQTGWTALVGRLIEDQNRPPHG
jgi:hypothetical protein